MKRDHHMAHHSSKDAHVSPMNPRLNPTRMLCLDYILESKVLQLKYYSKTEVQCLVRLVSRERDVAEAVFPTAAASNLGKLDMSYYGRRLCLIYFTKSGTRVCLRRWTMEWSQKGRIGLESSHHPPRVSLLSGSPYFELFSYPYVYFSRFQCALAIMSLL